MPAQSDAARLQIGVETTSGSAVVANRIHRYNDLTYSVQEFLQTYEDQISNTLAKFSTRPKVRRRGTEVAINEFLSFEQVLLPLLAGVRGGVTASTPTGATLARTWTFTPDLNAAPSPETFTVEYTERRGTSRDASEAPYCFASAFTIAASISATPTMATTLMGRRTSTSTETTGIALPDLHYGNELRWGLYEDSAWSGVGTTLVEGQVLDLSVTWSDFLMARYFGDLRADSDFSSSGFSATRMLDITGTVAVDPAATGFTTRHKAYKADGTPRIYRLRLVGPIIEGTSNYYLNVDFAGVHAEDSLQDYGSDQDGMNVRSLHLQSIEYATGTGGSAIRRDVSFQVQNALATYP